VRRFVPVSRLQPGASPPESGVRNFQYHDLAPECSSAQLPHWH
jgi:hypothetical protein